MLRLSTIIAPFIEGEELARSLHARSLALAEAGREAAALKAARQAAALAPFAVPIRWTLAVRLWKAGRNAEAAFEFSAQAPKLQPSDPNYAAMMEQYRTFEAEQEMTP